MRRFVPDLGALALLFVLPLVLFWAQTVGGRTLIPAENLYQYEPYATYREVAGAPSVPQNALVSDLVLQNFQWKTFIRQSLAAGEIPLWNPHQFGGIPFLAAGQQSALYPLSLLYYVLPLPAAYGWFTVVQLWLAGAFLYAFLRGLGVGRVGAALGGIVYELSGFFVISAVFPMIIGAAAWLPLILLMVEFTLRQRPALRGRPASIPWVIGGGIALGCNILAGHVEITYYVLLITAYYAGARLLVEGWRKRHERPLRALAARAGWLVLMMGIGLALGAVQFVPLFEFAGLNYRDGRSSLEQVLGWAHPLRDLLQFALPNFYGNPSHHSYVDVFSGQTVAATVNALGQPITTIDWGIKNYVEGALYVGILPLALALYALVNALTPRPLSEPSPLTPLPHGEGKNEPPYRAIFALLTAAALTFMFGLPTYALLFYGFPGINQLHSPFRWIFAVTLGVAVLAGFGADALRRPAGRLSRGFGWGLLTAGALTLVGLLLSRLFYGQVEPLVERIFQSMAKATEAFADTRMFYSYQLTNVLILGVMLVGAGAVFLLARRGTRVRGLPLWGGLALALVGADLLIASWGFNPASDPALLDFTPPAIEWLQAQPGDWRYTTLDDPTQRPLMNANSGWRYGLDDVRGYESIIPKQIVDFMRTVAPQVQLDYNRVAPLYTAYPPEMNFDLAAALQSPRFNLLNVRYVMTHKSTDLSAIVPTWTLAYEDEAVRIWENPAALPRAFVTSVAAGGEPALDDSLAQNTPVTILSDSGREKFLDVAVTPGSESWLVVSETHLNGWRAFIRPRGGDDQTEQPLDTAKVLENFIGVNLSPAVLDAAFANRDSLPEAQQTALAQGQYTLRLVYSPVSFQLGLFASFIGVILAIFGGGLYLWRTFIGGAVQTSGVQVVARNSLAPIILNLFNRGIDFGFAFVMLRILGPEGSGIYTYAAFIFGWFDIFTNFGLNVYLTREVSRTPDKAWRTFYNTSALRFLLMAVGALLLFGFLTGRQALPGADPLTQQAVTAILLLYIGLLPNSLSTGMSALFYAFQKAEYPAAIATVATICKAVFGVAALAGGLGVVGLAGVSILTNFVTLGVMLYAGRDLLRVGREGQPQPFRPEPKLMRVMVGEGWPLMLNHFLATIFFQIDIVLIQTFHGDTMVGQYGVAYKWVAALNVIPAFFTMALLPVMSRLAHEDRPALKRYYTLAIKLLVGTALPVAVVFTALAYTLTGILGGREFLPDGAIATQLMIWSIPIGWINSLTQYVLIALDLQRRITRAFLFAVGFNLISNLILIPMYGYRAAAVTTIASELMLLIPFALLLRGAIGAVNWVGLLWKLVVSTGAMVAVLLVLSPVQPLLALVAGAVAYVVVLAALRPLSAEEWERLAPLLPGRLRRLVVRG